MKFRHKFAAALLALFTGGAAMGLDVMEGLMYALPAKTRPVIDGKFDDWNQAGKEWIAISRDIAGRFSGDVMVMYDDDALYLAVEALTAGGPLINEHKPGEKTWHGHSIEFRCIADPTVPFPLDIHANDRNHPSVKQWADRINTLSIWEETITHTPHIIITNAPPFNGTRNLIDPKEAEVKFTELKNPERYRMEARIPWKLLGVESGKNPFKPGKKMTAFWTVIWPQSLTQRAECLRIAPTNNFGWHYFGVKNWGQIEFLADGNVPRKNPTLAEYIKSTQSVPDCDSFVVDMPEKAMLSVNIVDEKGEILREIAGGELHDKGPATLYWDGFDWYGNAMKPGTYQWKAYIHQPLTPVFAGAAGTSAKVPYETADHKGNWGGNMGPPTSATGAKDGLYLLWGSNEGGSAIVKTDYENNVLWRNTPYVIDGGYGPHVSIAVNSRYVYVLSGWMNMFLTRYHAPNGLTAAFGENRFVKLDEFGPTPPQQLHWNAPMPSSNAVAVNETEVFIPFHYRGVIKVYDAETGAFKRELALPWARGVALDEKGDLYALSGRDTNGWHGDQRRVWHFAKGAGAPRMLFSMPRGQCENPWGIAVRAGKIFISDNGHSHQLFRYENGKLTGVFGAEGGRAQWGKYDSASLLNPAGIGFDGRGKLWIPESSLPNVFKCIDPTTLKVEKELFGDVGYCPPSWPDADDPLQVYVKEYFTNGIVRSQLKGDGTSAGVDAYWNFRKMQWPMELTEWAANYRVPFSFRGPKNRKYTYATALERLPATLVLQEGETMRPVNYLRNTDAGDLRVWTDANGDGIVRPAEMRIIDAFGTRKLEKTWRMGSSTVTPDGTLYIVGNDNNAYRIPLKDTLHSGALIWDFERAELAVEGIIPFVALPIHYTARETVMGIDVDSKGDMFFSFNANLPYAKPEWGTRLRFGLGHSGRFNAVKMTAFDRAGKRLFLAGRKATGVLGAGEMYHHWAQAGLLGDNYMAVSSEWTPFTLYTRDGFFVQSILADPNLGETPSPFSLGGGETFSGQLRYFPKSNKCYLYTGNTHGMVYRLDGLEPGGKIKGEKRFEGFMKLTRNVDPFGIAQSVAKPELLPLKTPLQSGNWGDRAVELMDNSGKPLAMLDLGYDTGFLYARFRVKSSRMFVNQADDPAMVFKQGDAVGLYFGKSSGHEKPLADDVRILGTVYQGKPVVIAMLAHSAMKKPFEYFTAAGGRWPFDFVGILPDSTARFVQEKDGYVMELAIPRKHLPEFDLVPGKKLGFEAEVLLSGQGVRGLQAIARNHLFTPRSAGQAKMVDDIPSEARSYPKYWGSLLVK